MARPRFSEVLVSRRHELGLSVSQASRILKLREDVLVAFEEGDYDHMPQSGYAQGMLSSYARYLGLNAREIVDLFQEDLYQHLHGTSSHELRRRTRDTQAGRGISGYDLPNEAGSRPKAYVEYRPLLPTSGGPAGDMGAFATTAPARPRTSVPLAGVGASAPGTRSAFATGPSGRQDLSSRPAGAHPYNTASPSARPAASTARRRSQGRRRRPDDQASRLLNERQRSFAPGPDERGQMRSGRLYRRDDVTARRVRPSDYTDDLRYDDHASPYAPASTISGRRSSRNIASVERPNVRRRQSRGRSRRPRGRGGVLGAVSGFLSDPRRALFALILLLAVVLTAIVVLSVGSCVNGRNQPSGTGQVVTVGTAGTGDDASQAGDGGGADATAGDDGDAADATDDAATGGETTSGQDATGDDAADDAGADGDAAATGDDEQAEETVVKVSVASGEVSWVEITCDGTSEVAESVTGPWSASYTVHDAITVQVDSPDAVTVTENGARRDFTSHAGGLGSLTIEGTPLPEDEDAAAGQGTDASGAAGTTGTAATGGTTTGA